MADEWYFVKGGNKLGPVTTSRLREMANSGQLLAADLIWREGIADWTPANQLSGFFTAQSTPLPALRAPPPPRPKAEPAVAFATRSSALQLPAARALGSATPNPAMNAATVVGLVSRTKVRQMVLVGIVACLIPSALFAVWAGPQMFSSPVQDARSVIPGQMRNPSANTSGSVAQKATPSASLSKASFRQKLLDLGWSGINGTNRQIQAVIQKEQLFDAFGKPSQTATVGKVEYWYWQCSDGTIAIVKSAIFGKGLGNDEVGAVYLHRVEDF